MSILCLVIMCVVIAVVHIMFAVKNNHVNMSGSQQIAYLKQQSVCTQHMMVDSVYYSLWGRRASAADSRQTECLSPGRVLMTRGRQDAAAGLRSCALATQHHHITSR